MFPPSESWPGVDVDAAPECPGPCYEIRVSEIDHASFSWEVRAGGSTLGGGVAEDAELARLRAERFIEDRREG